MRIIADETVDDFDVYLIEDSSYKYRIVGANTKGSTYTIHINGSKAYALNVFDDHVTTEEEYA
jgi:hypothetical protein